MAVVFTFYVEWVVGRFNTRFSMWKLKNLPSKVLLRAIIAVCKDTLF